MGKCFFGCTPTKKEPDCTLQHKEFNKWVAIIGTAALTGSLIGLALAIINI